jgi:predicted RNA-binding Zn ribbon-like protein
VSTLCEIVDGIPLPARLGRHPALDFCNTLAGWDLEEPYAEYLTSYESLVTWAGSVGLLDSARTAALRACAVHRTRDATALLERARRFRAALYPLLLTPPSEKAPAIVDEELKEAAAALRLSRTGSVFAWDIEPSVGLELPLLATAWSAASLLTSPDLRLVRACPGRGCGWLFLDRRGRRRWCTMAVCGNRQKARRFSSRHRAPRRPRRADDNGETHA